MLIIRNLGCELSGRKVFNNISFSLKEGEVIAVTGSASSGKTILAYCLTGIIPYRINGEIYGEAILDGENILRRKPGELIDKIGFLMQNYEIQIFGLTVEEELRYALENIGLDEKEITKRINYVLNVMGLEGFRYYKTSQLSSGMKKKLILASLIALKPKVMILDDPLLNLDWIGVEKLKDAIQRLKREGISFIILTKCSKWLEDIIDKTISLDNNVLHSNSECDRDLLPYTNTRINTNSSSDPDNTLASMENTWFKYSDTDYVIKNISLVIKKRDIISLLGPNGSGKTTLIKLLTGLLKPSKGRVVLAGKDTRRYSASSLARHATIVFQNPDRYIVFDTIWDEVSFGCRNLGLPPENIENALRIVGLYEKRFEAPYKLSSSEKYKVGIASAIAIDPDILILDEPPIGCDPEIEKIIKSITEYMYRNNKAAIIVTHDTDLAVKLSNRVAILKNGILVADTKPEALYNDRLANEIGIRPVYNKKIVREEMIA